MADVVVTSREGLLQEVAARTHRFYADEPLEDGGTDAGPTPYDLLLAALGTCSSMTMRMYAERKGWPLEGVIVELHHDRVDADDCRNCESESAFIDRIMKRITLTGPLDEAQRHRLVEIAARCPVHRTLMNEIRIEQHLVLDRG